MSLFEFYSTLYNKTKVDKHHSYHWKALVTVAGSDDSLKLRDMYARAANEAFIPFGHKYVTVMFYRGRSVPEIASFTNSDDAKAYFIKKYEESSEGGDLYGSLIYGALYNKDQEGPEHYPEKYKYTSTQQFYNTPVPKTASDDLGIESEDSAASIPTDGPVDESKSGVGFGVAVMGALTLAGIAASHRKR